MEKIILEKENYSFKMQEEIKTLRTNIQFAGNNKKNIVITSCVQGEGKSGVSIKLAVSLTELKKKVLLIDADLRASVMIGKVEKGTTREGLSHYLSGQATLDQVIYDTNIPNLHMILAGPTPPNPTELLSSAEFQEIFLKGKEKYDYIIVDSAPLGVVIDAAIIANFCDASIMVVESSSLKYKFIQEVKKKLDDTGCPILGVVLTKKKGKDRKGYYGKYYKRYGYYGKNSKTDQYKSFEEKVKD